MAVPDTLSEAERAAALVDAEQKAVAMFNKIEPLVRPGVGEKELSETIHKLGVELYDVKTHWHKRVVRSGPNTLCPFNDNPPDRIIQEDDIVVVDLGPVFEQWEADFGRTYVLGNDPEKIKLRDALEPLWKSVKAEYQKNPDMTGEELYDIACKAVEKDGWIFGAHLAGHIVGSFPHERIPRDKTTLYISKGNDKPMTTPGKDGKKRHWILEIHLREPQQRYGGFMEQLLTA
ncbi:unnamed protein product [Clonostachys rhizophaga]|uniref:Peptidase M24 domain-containing protein n=1 Tax=Clonostachys rhizophaga TaxID=160324 RepID=A0A9N9VMJ4_9HYPO|nr:unnamed protein product [Clonostachys rhizophaga]